MKKPFTIFLITLIFVSKVFGSIDPDKVGNYTKSILPPSPDAWSMTRVGFIQPNKFKGSASYSFPVYNYRTKHLSVPISLNYSSNGVKVDEMASYVGLQWNMVAGGVINRVVRDDPDERDNFLLPKNLDVYSQESVDLIKNGYDDNRDTEPDLYLFNFMGHSGKFVIDPTTDIIHGVPITNLKIEFLDNNNVIKVTDGQGVVYLFGENGAVETSINENTGQNCGREYLNQGIITAWYLTSIIHPTGEEIKFEYEANPYSYYTSYSESVKEIASQEYCPGSSSSSFPQFQNSYCIGRVQTNGKVLKRIYSENQGEVDFEYSSRNDSNGKRLEWISIFDPDGMVITRFKLTPFYSQNNYYRNSKLSNSVSKDLYSRMFLQKITKYGTDTNKIEEEYSFEYDNPNGLPARLSMSQDHWGYFNGHTNNTFLPAGNYNGLFVGYATANRDLNVATNHYGVLTKIKYPTGGYQVLEYEPNTFYGVNNQNITTGGLRIKKLELFDKDDSLKETKEYIYASLNDIAKSSGVSRNNGVVIYTSSQYVRSNCSTPGSYVEGTYEILKSSSITTLFIGGNEVIYPTVIEKQTDNYGKISYLETKYNYAFNNTGKLIYGSHYLLNATTNNEGYYNGEIASQNYYTEENNNIRKVRSINYYYSELPEIEDTIYGYVIRKNFDEALTSSTVNYTCKAGDVGRWDGYLYSTVNKSWPLITRHFNVDGHKWSQFARAFVKKPTTRSEVDGTKWAWQWYWESPCTYVGQVITNNNLLNSGAFDVMQYRIYSKFRYLSKKTVIDYPKQGGEFKTEEDYYYDNLKSLAPTKTVVETSLDNTPQVTYIKYPSDFQNQNRINVTDYERHIRGFGSKVVNKFYLNFIPSGSTTISGSMTIDRNSADYIENVTPTTAELSLYNITEDTYVISHTINEGTFNYPSTFLNPNDKYLLYIGAFGTPMEVNLAVNQFISEENPINDNINKLIEKNLVTKVISKSVTKGDKYIQKLDFMYNDSSQLIKIYEDTTVLGNIYSFDPTKIYDDKNKVLEKKYSENGNLIEQIYKQNHVAYFWGYNKTKPVARVENASYNDIFYTSFEETGLETPDAYTGSKCASGSYTKHLTGLNNGTYILEYFVRNGETWEMKHSAIQVTTNGYTISINEPGKLIDEVRFYPQNAQMTTYTYKPLVGITSITDPRGEATLYVYDDFGRLKYIKDKDKNILKRYTYHYYNQPVTEDFNVELYTITTKTNGYGAVSVTPDPAKKGTNVSVNITPYAGYKISSITVDGQPQSINSSFTISSVQKDLTVDVQFAIKTYTVTKTIDGGTGSVSISPTTVNHGGSTTVSLYPGSGYMVDYVKVGTTTYPVSNNKATITGITSNINVHVKFKPQVTLTVNPTYLSFDFVDSPKRVTVTASGSWTVSASVSWITVIPSSGSGNGTFDVSVLKNNDATRRTGHVTVTNGSSSVTISVEQAAGLGGFK